VQKSPELEAMWAEYKRTEKVDLRNRLIEAYLPLVDYLSERIAERLPRCVDVEEVRSAGVLGLLDAVEGFDLTRNIKFETYCSLRIRGSILDELRSRDWVPRLVRSRAQKFGVAVRKLQADIGRAPTADEVMRELKISPEEYESLLKDVARLAIYSLSQTDESDDDASPGARFASLVDRRHPDPIAELQKHEATGVVLGELIDKERDVLELYYFEGLTMKEIGKLLRLSESRVCQIHGQALTRLRGELVGRAEDLGTS
jgi:RNA polymerase sigma factor for flagellar operon FliA